MKNALSVTLAVVAALVRWTEGQLSCDFGWRDMCDWTSETNATNTMEWTVGFYRKNSNYPWNYYARLDVGGYRAGDQGVLASPWLRASPPGSQCRLQFRYYLEKDHGCRLSLLHEKAGIMSVLWNSTTSSNFDVTFSSYLDCTRDQHKLYFKGERISNRDYACGGSRDYDNNEIDVDNIVYLVIPGEPPPTSPPTTTITSTLTSTSTFSTTSEGGSTASDRLTSNNTEGLSSALIAGITIAAILVVVVIAVVVIIIISRRRDGDGDKTATWLARYFRKTKPPSASLNNTRRAGSNSGYVPDDQIMTSDQGDRVGFSHPHNQNNDQVLAIVPVGQINPYETLNTDGNESRPYEILPSQASPYETLARGNVDNNAYDILFSGRQDTDGYELPVASPPNNRAALQDNNYNN